MTTQKPSVKSGADAEASPPSEASSHQLQELQRALLRVLETVIIRADVGSALLDLPMLQVKCLHIIAMQEGQKLVDVARQMQVGVPSVSRIVDRLVRCGMVERRPDPKNRRALQLGLTDTSRAILAEVRAARQAHLELCTQGLDAEAMSKVIEGLKLLANSAEQAQESALPISTAALSGSPIAPLLTRYPRRRQRAEAKKRG